MNLKISRNFMTDWCKATFKDYRLQSGGDEFVTNSFIVRDTTKHLSINLETGLWQDFKAGQAGNFVRLYALINEYSYQQAQQRLLLKHLDVFTWDDDNSKDEKKPRGELDIGKLTPIHMGSAYSTNKRELDFWVYLFGRQLLSHDLTKCETHFYYSDNPRLAGRIVIPFFNGSTPFYYQARSLEDASPKYLNPEGHITGIKSSDVLYPFNDFAEYLIVCEGPLDAISLQLQGVNATCTMGSRVSKTQAEILRDFRGKIVMGYDNDAAGARGVAAFNNLRKQLAMDSIYYCRPPALCKDWNDAHKQEYDLRRWVKDHTVCLDWFNLAETELSSIS